MILQIRLETNFSVVYVPRYSCKNWGNHVDFTTTRVYLQELISVKMPGAYRLKFSASGLLHEPPYIFSNYRVNLVPRAFSLAWRGRGNGAPRYNEPR